MKKLTIKSLFLLCSLNLLSCSVVLRPADNRNPCARKYRIECEEWKTKYPKEYARYQERVRKSEMQANAAQ